MRGYSTSDDVDMPVIVKYLIVATIVVVASEIAKRNDRLGALIVALPMVPLLVMIWLHIESSGNERATKVADHAYYTFWYVLPTLPMFLVVSKMLREGMNFWVVVAAYLIGTWLLFYLSYLLLKKFGIYLI